AVFTDGREPFPVCVKPCGESGMLRLQMRQHLSFLRHKGMQLSETSVKGIEALNRVVKGGYHLAKGNKREVRQFVDQRCIAYAAFQFGPGGVECPPLFFCRKRSKIHSLQIAPYNIS